MNRTCIATRSTLAAMLLSASASAEAGGSVGKYVCVVSELAGIQFEKNGSTTSGSFKPSDEKFFLTIAQTTPLQECPTTKMHGLNYWYFCLSKFAAQINNGLVMRGDTIATLIAPAGGDYLELRDDMTFSRMQGVLTSGTGYYVSEGKCTKI